MQDNCPLTRSRPTRPRGKITNFKELNCFNNKLYINIICSSLLTRCLLERQKSLKKWYRKHEWNTFCQCFHCILNQYSVQLKLLHYVHDVIILSDNFQPWFLQYFCRRLLVKKNIPKRHFYCFNSTKNLLLFPSFSGLRCELLNVYYIY